MSGQKSAKEKKRKGERKKKRKEKRGRKQRFHKKNEHEKKDKPDGDFVWRVDNAQNGGKTEKANQAYA